MIEKIREWAKDKGIDGIECSEKQSLKVVEEIGELAAAIIRDDVTDLYEPTGCWSPTFKASYNDIALLVQTAVKQLNKLYRDDLSKNNFVIVVDESDELTVSVKEF